MRILLVDDDEHLAQTLTSCLVSQHYAVDIAMDGESAWNYTQATVYDLILLDVNLPKLDGVRLCQRLRQSRYNGPILLLTAKGDSSDKVMGLDAGADDYLVKPCTIEELSARIRALLRRQHSSAPLLLEWGDLSLDPAACEVTYQGQLLNLSPKEYGLLELFLRNPQRVFSSSIILDHLWGIDAPGEETVRTHIKRLRRKLKSAGGIDVIDTVYGMGYRLKPSEEPPATAIDPSAANQARAAVLSLWEQFKPPILERLISLSQAVADLKVGRLSDELRQTATRDAHKLAGSLGMFGFPEGSRLSQAIEDWFHTPAEIEGLEELQSLVTALHQELQHPPQSSDGELLTSLVEESTEIPASTDVERVPDLLPAPPTQPKSQKTQAPDLARSPQVKVLVVDDDPLILKTLQQFLPRWGICPVTLSQPSQLWDVLERECPDLLILDVDMPHTNGIELCQVIRNESDWNGLPILFLTAHRDPDMILQLYSAGADDYVAKPFTEPEVVTRIFNRLERHRLLRNLAEIDTLTGLVNQQRSTQDINRYLSCLQHEHQPLCIAVIDIDHFKQVNYQHGHAVGDIVLKRLAAALLQTFRGGEIVARWGGDEFLVGMYGIQKGQARERLNQVLQSVHQAGGIQVTFSAGIAEAPADGLDLQQLYWVADVALQQAKIAGYNHIFLAQ